MQDSFQTIERPARTEHKVRGSRFIAESFRARSREKADDQIAAVRKRAHQATHHCSAFRLGPRGDVYAYDDDGEPSGTAGAPILRQLEGRGLTQALVVVTRYYGGTKLGTGGLARAYSEAAAGVLDASGTAIQIIRRPVKLQFDYADTAAVEQLLREFGPTRLSAEYTGAVEMTVGVRRSRVDDFLRAFTNAVAGRGDVRELNSDEQLSDG